MSVEKINFALLLQSARSGGPRGEPVGGGHRQSIGQDDRERWAAWWSLSSGAANPRAQGTRARRSRGANARSSPIPVGIWLACKCTLPTSKIAMAHLGYW